MATFTKDVEEIRKRAMQKIEEGAVTDSYTLDKDKSVMILNEALATEIVCVLRYQHHYFMATGVHGRSVAKLFKSHADEEREHADELAERIQQLGGKPNFNPGDLVQRSVSQYIEGETLADMIREDLIAERMVIDVYQRMIEYFGTQDPTTRTLIEHIKAEEEDHASELSDMMFIVNPETGEDEGQDPGTNPLERHLNERGDSGGQQRSVSGGSESNSVKSKNSDENSIRDWGNESNVGMRGNGSPVRRSTAPKESGWGNEQNVGSHNQSSERETSGTSKQASRGIDRSGSDKKNTNITNRRDEDVTPRAARGKDVSGQVGRSAADRQAKDRGASKKYNGGSLGLRGESAPPASNIPGVSGRPMNRRKNESLDIDTDDVAERPNSGGASGRNRSPRIIQKNRKSKRAA